MNDSLRTRFIGKELSNPIIVGTGPCTKNTSDILEAEKYGAGAAIIKSIGWHTEVIKSEKDRKRYRWIRGYGTYLKSTYLCEILSKPYGCELIKNVKKATDFPLYASVFYPSLQSDEDINRWTELVGEVTDAGCDAIQLDFFYLDTRKLSGDEINFFLNAVDQICNATPLPVMPKINLRMDDDLVLALATRSLSAGLVIDIWNNGEPLFDGVLYNNQTGRSGSVIAGEALLPFTLSMTQHLYRATNKDLSAGGGEGWEDIVRCIMSGASTVHLTSVLMRRGIKYIRDLNASIKNFLDKKGVENISRLRGISYVKAGGGVIIRERQLQERKATVDASRCNDCGICEKLRVCNSFSVKPYDFQTHCDGCSFCIQFCPRRAISLKEERHA